MLRSLLKKVNKHSLEDELIEIANICESQLEKIARERLEEIDCEVDEVISDLMAVPDEVEIMQKHPSFCEGCEE
jgi:hypothetical protein